MRPTDSFQAAATATAVLPAATDLNLSPWVVIWELTQACALACRHCRASAQALRHPAELTTEEGRRLLDDIAALQPAVLVLTGGDPLVRPDLFELARHAVGLGLDVALTPSGTPNLNAAAIEQIQASGINRIAVSLDGATAASHDRFRGVAGSFAVTLAAAREAARRGLPVQVNTTANKGNVAEMAAIRDLLDELGIAMWSVFFVVPVGRAAAADMLDADEVEALFGFLYETGARGKFLVRTTEAPHYRRYLRQRQAETHAPNPAFRWSRRAAPRGIGDGAGLVFVSHTGEVYPSGFLPLSAGNVRHQPLGTLYRESPVFRAIRDRDQLGGKCGQCEFRRICGGSRARAYAMTGDYLAEDPVCAYHPRGLAVQ
jgi:radical SAM protein